MRPVDVPYAIAEYRLSQDGLKFVEECRRVRSCLGKKAQPSVPRYDFTVPNLPDGWCWASLSEVCERVSVGHVGPTSQYFSTAKNAIPLIRSQDVRPGKLHVDNTARITPEFHQQLKKSALRTGDILFVRVGANRGDCCVVPKDVGEINCANIVFARPLFPTGFFGFYFRSDFAQQMLLGVTTGAAQGVINTECVARMPVPIPPRRIQERVSGLLSAYDDQIENNTRRIEILEQMAHMFYREWFIKFRFPGHKKVKLVESELGYVPEGWCQPYSESVDFLEGPGLRKWDFREEGIPFLNVRNLIEHDIDTSKCHCVEVKSGMGKYRHFLLAEGDHVVSSSGTLGRVATVGRRHLPLMLNTGIIRMRVKTPALGKWQIKHFLQSEYFQKQILSFAMGVAQIHFGPSHLRRMKVISPPLDIGQQYEGLVQPIEELLCNLVERNCVLRTTRDLLLPKLVSGEISVEQIEKEAVAQMV